jgi:helix-turn-helix protein
VTRTQKSFRVWYFVHMQQSTSTAVQDIGKVAPAKPEWLRVWDATRVSGIGRSTLYMLIKSGEVRSASIRKRNRTRGIRLINRDSLNDYIEKFAK